MKNSLDKLTVEYMVIKDEFFSILSECKEQDFAVKLWKDNNSPFYYTANILDKNKGCSIALYYGIKYKPPAFINGKNSYFPLRLQFNPNKVSMKINQCISHLHEKMKKRRWAVASLDLAIDFNAEMENVFIISKYRKERQPFDTTLYYGKRNSDGSLKFYDKALESGLDDTLSRVEYTYKPKSGQGRTITTFLLEKDFNKRYNILHLEKASENEKATIKQLAGCKKSSLSKKQRVLLEQLINKYQITIKNLDLKAILYIFIALKDMAGFGKYLLSVVKEKSLKTLSFKGLFVNTFFNSNNIISNELELLTIFNNFYSSRRSNYVSFTANPPT